MKLSFIVITYQRGQLLRSCIDSIISQTGIPQNRELIIVDNGNNAVFRAPDQTWGTCHLHRSTENLGVAGGRNKGIELASGDYLIFMDDDAIFTDTHIVSRMLHIFEDNPRCGIVAGRSLTPDHETIVAELPFPDKTYAASRETHTPAPYFYGVIHAIRATALGAMQPYPQRYVYSMEELDLSLRIIDAGWEIIFDPSVTVIHYKSPLGREVIGDQYWYRNALNKMQLGWRLLPLPYPITIMVVWSVASLWYTKNPRVLWRIWRDFFKMIPELRRERQPIRTDALAYLRRVGGRLWY